MYKLIIFDIDGTLIDTTGVVKETYQYAISEGLGRNLTDEELEGLIGVPTVKAIKKFNVRDYKATCDRYFNKLFEAFSKDVKPFDGIVELLEELVKRKIQCAIVTSRNRSEIGNDAALSSILKYFATVVSFEDTQRHKPDPEPIIKLLEITGHDVSDVIYIGDTYSDYRCALDAGVKFALASWGAKPDDRIRADYTLAKPSDLFGLLE
jgi:HAD superfamily hydrolase (TIGR01549 family)